jgi:hypothetical protein
MISTGVDQRAECVRQLQTLIGHDEILRKLCNDYAPRRRQTRSNNDYAFEQKIAEIMAGNWTFLRSTARSWMK